MILTCHDVVWLTETDIESQEQTDRETIYKTDTMSFEGETLNCSLGNKVENCVKSKNEKMINKFIET